MSIGAMHYVVPPELRGGNIPSIVQRGDSRSPDEIFRDGFGIRRDRDVNRDSLFRYVNFQADGPYVSTTRDSAIANDFGRPDGWVYDIQTPTDRAIDVNHALGDDVNYPEEEEIAIAGGIGSRDIRSARNTRTGVVVSNPNFDLRNSPPPPADPSAPGGRIPPPAAVVTPPPPPPPPPSDEL